MKFSLKSIAAAVVMAASASASFAAIDNGAGGNGGLFFSAWDANGSYSRSLNISIDSFQAAIAAAGSFDQTWASDAAFTGFMSTADTASLKWNIVAFDTSGAQRIVETYSTLPAVAVKDTIVRASTTGGQQFVNAVNSVLVGDSAVVGAASSAWAGKSTFNDTFGLMNFSNAGSVANNSYASGLGVLRIDSKATGQLLSINTPYVDGTAVNAWVAADGLHIAAAVAAVPEPESYAMFLAGLGMLGFMARRNKRA